MFQSVSIFSLYNPLFQCFGTPEMGPGIFTFSRACFNFVSKRFETTETFGLSRFSSVSVVSVLSLYNPLFQCFETPEMGPGIFTFSRACFNFVSKRYETTETFGLSQFSSYFSPFQFFPYIIHCFSVSKHQKWGLVFSLFQSLFQFCFETTETFGLSQFSSCFSPFQFYPYIIHCFSVSKHQKWVLVFSLFPELVSILFRNVMKQLKRLDLVNFLPISVRFKFFPI